MKKRKKRIKRLQKQERVLSNAEEQGRSKKLQRKKKKLRERGKEWRIKENYISLVMRIQR